MSKKNSIFAIISLIPILYGVIRNGHEGFNSSVVALIIIADLFALVAYRKVNIKSYGKELWIGIVVMSIEMPIQLLFYGSEHYEKWNAFCGIATLALMVASIPILVRKKNGIIIWRTIVFIGEFNAVLIILQYSLKVVGLRIDQFGFVSDLLFQAWEFHGGAVFRACGMFSEPSHFAEVGLLTMFYCLFINNDYKKTILVWLALILSTSSLGIFGSIILVILYILGIERFTMVRYSFNNKLHNLFFFKVIGEKIEINNVQCLEKKGVNGIVVILTILFIIFATWWASESTDIVIKRLFSGASIAVRTMRSFELYSIIDVPGKIFGIGLLNQELFLNYNNIILASDNYETIFKNREFAQTFGYILCTTGILGLISFGTPFFCMAWKKRRLKVLLLLFLIVCTTCCILTRFTFLLYLLAIYSLIDYEKSVSTMFFSCGTGDMWMKRIK